MFYFHNYHNFYLQKYDILYEACYMMGNFSQLVLGIFHQKLEINMLEKRLRSKESLIIKQQQRLQESQRQKMNLDLELNYYKDKQSQRQKKLQESQSQKMDLARELNYSKVKQAQLQKKVQESDNEQRFMGKKLKFSINQIAQLQQQFNKICRQKRILEQQYHRQIIQQQMNFPEQKELPSQKVSNEHLNSCKTFLKGNQFPTLHSSGLTCSHNNKQQFIKRATVNNELVITHLSKSKQRSSLKSLKKDESSFNKPNSRQPQSKSPKKKQSLNSQQKKQQHDHCCNNRQRQCMKKRQEEIRQQNKKLRNSREKLQS